MTENPIERAYKQYGDENQVSDDLVDPDLFFEIFREALSSDIYDRLFDENIPPARKLTPKDFKDAETRRVQKGWGRLFAATWLSQCLCDCFEQARKRQPASKRLEVLNDSIPALEVRVEPYRTKHHKELNTKQFESLVALASQREERELLSQIVESGGDGFPNRSENSPKRKFAYDLLHLTFCLFGDGTNERGKGSGRGLPALTAKISNLMFPEMTNYSARDVSVIYKQASERIREGNLQRMADSTENDS